MDNRSTETLKFLVTAAKEVSATLHRIAEAMEKAAEIQRCQLEAWLQLHAPQMFQTPQPTETGPDVTERMHAAAEELRARSVREFLNEDQKDGESQID